MLLCNPILFKVIARAFLGKTTSVFALGPLFSVSSFSILWRILTYYIYLILGIGIVSYDYIYGNKKAKRRKQKLKSMNNI